MKKVYYLSTCNTCTRIMKEVGVDKSFDIQDIKKQAINIEQIEELRELSDSYEALFNKRSRKYQSMGLKDKSLTEEDYKQLILEEYTFLKRPVFIIDGILFLGNSKKTVETLKNKLAE